MPDETPPEITAAEQVRILTEQVGKLQQSLADERDLYSILKAEYKARTDQGDALIAADAAREKAISDLAALQAEQATLLACHAQDHEDMNAATARMLEAQAALDVANHENEHLRAQLAPVTNTSPKEPDAPHPE